MTNDSTATHNTASLDTTGAICYSRLATATSRALDRVTAVKRAKHTAYVCVNAPIAPGNVALKRRLIDAPPAETLAQVLRRLR